MFSQQSRAWRQILVSWLVGLLNAPFLVLVPVSIGTSEF